MKTDHAEPLIKVPMNKSNLRIKKQVLVPHENLDFHTGPNIGSI